MSRYRYTVTGDGPEMTIEGAAVDPAGAFREAVLFASEILRDLGESGVAREIGVEACMPDGQPVCRIVTTVTPFGGIAPSLPQR